MTRLKKLRMSQNITVTELSKKTNIPQPSLTLIENGQRNPSFRVADRIASYFQIPVEDLFPQFKRHSPYPKNTSKAAV